jgi:hypothetical protein
MPQTMKFVGETAAAFFSAKTLKQTGGGKSLFD